MNLADIISVDRTRISADATSKKRALEQLADILAEDTPYLSSGEIFSALIAREKLGSTGLGEGVAIPHGRVKELDECVGALIRLPRDGVGFEAADEQPVDILFGLLVPQDSTETHLQILRGLAEMFTQEDVVTRLRSAGDDAALHAALLENDPLIQDA